MMIKPGKGLEKAGVIGAACMTMCLACGCAAIIEGSAQKIRVHCQPSDGLQILVDGKATEMLNGELKLDKKRETHFVTFSRADFSPSTISFDREVNPFWPVADLVWGPAFPLAWLVDWLTGAVYRIDPRDLHVVLRKQE